MARLAPFEVAGAEILLAARTVSWRVCANVPRPLRGGEPEAPVVVTAAAAVQQRPVGGIFRAAQRLVALEQRRTTDRRQFVGHQQVSAQARPAAASRADRGIDIAAPETNQ